MVARGIKAILATAAATASTVSGTALMVAGGTVAPATRATSTSICSGGWGASGVFTHNTQKADALAIQEGGGTSSAFAVGAEATIPTAFTTPAASPEQQQQQQKEQTTTEKQPQVPASLVPLSETAALFISSASLFPDSTEAERRRFLMARKGDVDEAAAMLCRYLEFRQQFAAYLSEGSSAAMKENQERLVPEGAELVGDDFYYEAHEVVLNLEGDGTDEGNNADSKVSSKDKSRFGNVVARRTQSEDNSNSISSVSRDERLWHIASKAAVLHHEDGVAETSAENLSYLPRIARFDYQDPNEQDQYRELLSLSNHRIVQVFPGLLELDKASAQTYAVSLALYLDSQLDRESMEKVTVVVDLRAGKGWPNPTPRSVLPFIRTVVKLLNDHFPERLAKCVVFPLPYAARVIWQLVKVFLDTTTASKISIISGAALESSSPPTMSMLKHFDESTINAMEHNRLSAFVTDARATQDSVEAVS